MSETNLGVVKIRGGKDGWYSIYRKFLRRCTRYYCGKMWCGLSVKREEGGAALRELVWRYLGKPPPLTPLLKWLGEDYA